MIAFARREGRAAKQIKLAAGKGEDHLVLVLDLIVFVYVCDGNAYVQQETAISLLRWHCSGLPSLHINTTDCCCSKAVRMRSMPCR